MPSDTSSDDYLYGVDYTDDVLDGDVGNNRLEGEKARILMYSI